MRWDWYSVDHQGRRLPRALQNLQLSGLVMPLGALLVTLAAVLNVGWFARNGTFAAAPSGRRAELLVVVWSAALCFGAIGLAVRRASAWTRPVLVGVVFVLALVRVLFATDAHAADRARDATVKLGLFCWLVWYLYFKRDTVRYYQSIGNDLRRDS